MLVKRFFFLLNAAFAMEILDLISQVHLPSSVNMLPKYLKYFTFSSCFWSIIIIIIITIIIIIIPTCYYLLSVGGEGYFST